jgi:hypothetical protein
MIEFGVCPSDISYAKSTVYPKMLDVMKKADVLGFVDISGEISRNKSFTSQFPAKHLFFCDGFLVMDPGALLGYSDLGALNHPWTEKLKNKRVLTISSHHESINHQWSNINNIWKDKKNIIVPFDFVGNIRGVFHPSIDDRQYANNWLDTIECIKREIDKYDFDVLLSSVAQQSPFYVDYAKSKGKIGIQVGGSLQLFFGIIGKRWNMDSGGHRNWKKMFNENWIYPLKIDEPQKINQIRNLEMSFAYWSGSNNF